MSKLTWQNKYQKPRNSKKKFASGKLVGQANSPKHQQGEEEPNLQMEKDRNSEDEDKYADDTDILTEF